MVVKGIADCLGVMPVWEVDMRDLALGVNAGIGAAGDSAGDGFARTEARRRLFQYLLHRQSVDLSLPSHKRSAVVFKQQRPTSHCPRMVPGGTGWPRKKAPASSAARPGS